MKQVTSLSEFDSLLSSADPQKLIVIDFTATWCGPCAQIAPFFQSLADKNRHVVFAKVDVDANQDISSRAGVSAMPTFQFFKNKVKVHELKGADRSALEAAITQHQGPADVAAIPAGVLPGHYLLNDVIQKAQVDCLNQNKNSVANVWKEDGYLESDCDEQLIISVPFNETVKVSAIVFHAPVDKGPKTVKTFVNLPNTPSFEDADNNPEIETLTLSYSPDGAALAKLRFVRYQVVNSIQLFIVDNVAGGDQTVVNNIDFYGITVETTKQITEAFTKKQ